MAQTYKTGGDCDAYCTKCKMDLAHTIVAMVGGEPVQVKCNTCGGFHKYRPTAAARATSKATSKAARTTAKRSPAARSSSAAKAAATRALRAKERALAEIEARWEGAMDGRDKGSSRPYDVHETYAEDDIVLHAKFGLGIVLEVTGAKRAKVLFRDAERQLVMGY